MCALLAAPGGAPQLEIGLRVSEVSRLALSLSHLSNGGLGEHNPGQETVALACEVRLGRNR